jgi:ABC-type polysaccharide/polyol phosphate export permease
MTTLAWAPFADITNALPTITRICAALAVVAAVIFYASRQADLSGILMIIGRLLVAFMALGFILAFIKALTPDWPTAAN